MLQDGRLTLNEVKQVFLEICRENTLTTSSETGRVETNDDEEDYTPDEDKQLLRKFVEKDLLTSSEFLTANN